MCYTCVQLCSSRSLPDFRVPHVPHSSIPLGFLISPSGNWLTLNSASLPAPWTAPLTQSPWAPCEPELLLLKLWCADCKPALPCDHRFCIKILYLCYWLINLCLSQNPALESTVWDLSWHHPDKLLHLSYCQEWHKSVELVVSIFNCDNLDGNFMESRTNAQICTVYVHF